MNLNPRIFGAFLVGASLIGAAYFLASETDPIANTDAATGVVVGAAPNREPVVISDSDNDGVPDWKEQFRQTEPVSVNESEFMSASYTPPDTLTDQIGIDFLRETIQSRVGGNMAQSKEQLLLSAKDRIVAAATDEMFSPADITAANDSSSEALRTYGNRVAALILETGAPAGTRSELEVVKHALEIQDEAVLEELSVWTTVYETLVREMLVIEPPVSLINEHLDLLNSYNAMYKNLEGLEKAMSDPLFAMARLKRYYDDVQGTHNAIRQLYINLYDAGARFKEGDMTLMLGTFSE